MRRLLNWAPGRSRHATRALAIPLLLLAAVALLGLAGRAPAIDMAPESLVDAALAGTARLGFTVDDIVVEGRKTTPKETVLDALAAGRGAPIFGVDLQRAKERLEALPWVRSATIVRRLPGTLYVALAEREPLALWQHDGKIELIDRQGGVIPATRLERFAKFPLVVGPDAATGASQLLAMLASEPDLALRVTAAIRVGGRRWNLRMDDTVDVMLPETGAAEAWARLARLERAQKLLERQVERVDLRLPDRLVLRLPPQPQPAAETKKGRQPAKNI